MKKFTLAALLSATLLAGCYSLPKPTIITMEQIRNLDYGRYPSDYEQIVKRHLARTLIDPNSLMLDGISKPRKFVRLERTYLPVKTDTPIRDIRGYIVCARINAKNRYGGYTGWQEHAYIIYNGQLYENVLGAQCFNQDELMVSVEAGAYIKVTENGNEIQVY